MDLTPNEGTRPSKLELSRYATGELTDAERAAVEDRLDDDGRAWLSEIAQAADSLPQFDPTALRSRAAGLQDAAPTAAPANNRRWFGMVALLAAAAVGFLLVGFPTDPAETDPNYIRARGTANLEVHRMEDGALRPLKGDAVGEGDQLGFRVDATGRDGVVLLSVDGNGQVSVFWPESGNRPEPLDGEGPVPLPGSLILDGAPGPEVFLAVYDQTAAEAAAYAARTWQSEGIEGLIEWSERADHVEAVILERR